MSMRVNRSAYETLIAEDIAWCEAQPRTLERDHVIAVLRESVDMHYPRCVERTPETVLRAMLKAYEAAALEADVAYFRAEFGTPEDAILRRATEQADTALSNLRDATAAAIIGDDPTPILKMWGLWPDYEARLSGARPLNARPLEEP